MENERRTCARHWQSYRLSAAGSARVIGSGQTHLWLHLETGTASPGGRHRLLNYDTPPPRTPPVPLSRCLFPGSLDSDSLFFFFAAITCGLLGSESLGLVLR